MNIFFRRNLNRLGYKMKIRKAGNKLIGILFCLFAVFLLYTYNFVFIPVLSEAGMARASQIGQNVVNRAVSEVMEKNRDTKPNLLQIEKDGEGQITAISPDIVLMNTLKSQIAISVTEKLNNTTNSKVRIPIGNITGISLLSNLGPRIGFNLVPYGKTEVDFETTFMEAGINQTRHRVDVQVHLSIALLLANKSISGAKIEVSVPISETIIVGDVPSSYTNLETKEESVREDALNILE